MANEATTWDKISEDLEQGRACPLANAITNIPFSDQLKIVKEIDDANARRRDSNPSLPDISFDGDGSHDMVRVMRTEPGQEPNFSMVLMDRQISFCEDPNTIVLPELQFTKK